MGVQLQGWATEGIGLSGDSRRRARVQKACRLISNLDIGVLPNRLSDAMSKGDQYKLGALAACKLHGRYEVAVCGHENDHLDLLFQRQAGDVQPDTHIDRLLLDIGFKVAGSELRCRRRLSHRFQLDSPTLMNEFAESKRKVIGSLKACV